MEGEGGESDGGRVMGGGGGGGGERDTFQSCHLHHGRAALGYSCTAVNYHLPLLCTS